MRVIRVGSDNFELLWDELWKNGARRYPLYGKFNRSFYSAYNDDKQHEDCSFIVEGQNGPLAGMMITSNVDSSGTTSFSVFNLPTLFILNEEILQIKLISFIIIWIGIIIYIYDSYKKEIILNNTQ